jgi:hypothetical protein
MLLPDGALWSFDSRWNGYTYKDEISEGIVDLREKFSVGNGSGNSAYCSIGGFTFRIDDTGALAAYRQDYDGYSKQDKDDPAEALLSIARKQIR